MMIDTSGCGFQEVCLEDDLSKGNEGLTFWIVDSDSFTQKIFSICTRAISYFGTKN